jgi:hypothetical protein
MRVLCDAGGGLGDWWGSAMAVKIYNLCNNSPQRTQKTQSYGSIVFALVYTPYCKSDKKMYLAAYNNSRPRGRTTNALGIRSRQRTCYPLILLIHELVRFGHINRCVPHITRELV